METFLDRLKAERAELAERLSRLKDFLPTEAANKLPPTQMACLLMQMEVMRFYLAILDRRLALLSKEEVQ